ncbi:MAG: hypothetical protein KKC85_01830 [Gammaproteobacteria bacterium]|nr:hypothetical protein [Gammaproteobacteria bacterium]MBU1444103.1 hypothetical protein [Gammaproteobacteria bacterium]MBU2285158.1 hypothetical protein [Gammaproteobacteria bacterium]
MAVAVLLAAPLQACAAEGGANGKPQKMTQSVMKANGSGVSVDYRVDGPQAVGQPASIVIEFDQITDPSGASVRFTASGGAVINGADTGSRTLAPGVKTTLTMSVVPPADGVGYLNVFTTQNGTTSAASIAVGKPPATMPSSGDLKQTPGGDSVITMPVK